MTQDPKAELNEIASRMRALHKLLLEHERKSYEKTYGRIENPYQLLNLAMEDPQFAWLRALSGEMVHLDEVRLNREGVPAWQVRLIGTRVRALMREHRKQTSFQQHLEDAKAEDPAILMAASELMRSLPPESDLELFVSAEEQKDPKDTTPGAIRPGKLVPGFGDKGYYALGAILESPLGTPIPTARFSNETVFGLASERTGWTVDGEPTTLDAWVPIVVNAGSGATVGVTSDADGMMVRLFIRQPEVGGEQSSAVSDVRDENGWMVLGDESSLGEGIRVYAHAGAANGELSAPIVPGHDAAVFVIAGEIEIDGVPVQDSQLAIVRDPGELGIATKSDAMVLVITLDPEVKVTRAGTVAR